MVKVQLSELVGVYWLGEPGVLMYVVLVEKVEPQVEVDMTQQTPKPAAHEPEPAPPLLVH